MLKYDFTLMKIKRTEIYLTITLESTFIFPILIDGPSKESLTAMARSSSIVDTNVVCAATTYTTGALNI